MADSTLAVEEKHVFNDNLLMHRSDLEFAERRFPRILHVLDHPRLRAEFAKYERIANQAREQV